MEGCKAEVNQGGQQVGKTAVLPVRFLATKYHCRASQVVLIFHIPQRNELPRLELCYQKKIFYIIEQPLSSLLWQYKPVKESCHYYVAPCAFHNVVHL